MNRVAHLHDQVHVVLDDDQHQLRRAKLHRAQSRDHAFRPSSTRPRARPAAARAVRRRWRGRSRRAATCRAAGCAGASSATLHDAQPGKRRQREFAVARALSPAARQRQEGIEPACGRLAIEPDHHVLGDAQFRAQRHMLKAAREAERGASRGRNALQADVTQPHAALLRRVESRQAIEETGLARTVGADQAGDLAGRAVCSAMSCSDLDAAEGQREVLAQSAAPPFHRAALMRAPLRAGPAARAAAH